MTTNVLQEDVVLLQEDVLFVCKLFVLMLFWEKHWEYNYTIKYVFLFEFNKKKYEFKSTFDCKEVVSGEWICYWHMNLS